MTRIQGDLLDRTYRFAVQVGRLVGSMPDGTLGWTFGRQLARAGTSVGANCCEADGALTDQEFAHHMNIARKEALETRYWLRLCSELELINPEAARSTLGEAAELIRVLTTIVRKTRAHIRGDAS